MTKADELVRFLETDPIIDSEKAKMEKMKAYVGEEAYNRLGVNTPLRFIRGYYNIPEEEMLKNFKTFIDWRAKEDIDFKMTQEYEKEARFNQLWPAGIHGTSKSGHTVIWERIGKIDIKLLKEEFKTEEMIFFKCRQQERYAERNEKLTAQGGNTDSSRRYKNITVMDMESLGWAHCSTSLYSLIKEFISVNTLMYSETMYKTIIINAPWYFTAVWTASSPFIHPITKSNFLFGVEHLKDYIDTDQIPQFVEGGKCQCEGGKCLQVPMQPDRSVVAVKEKEKERKEEKKAMNDSNSNTSDAAAEELAAGMSAVNINANSNDATATVNADIDASIATDAGANAGTDTGASASTGAGTDADALSTADNA